MHRLTFVFSICLFSISSLFAQASLRVSDQAVSRKEIKTIDGKQVKIQRLSEPNSPSNGDINLVKRDQYGKVIWSKFYGGSGYEYVGSLSRSSDDGFLIIGTTSSFGKGNNDIYLIKTDEDGKEIWAKTYGGFFNEYGKYLKELPNGNIIVKGQQQFCDGDNVGTNCRDEEWVFEVDSQGQVVAKL